MKQCTDLHESLRIIAGPLFEPSPFGEPTKARERRHGRNTNNTSVMGTGMAWYGDVLTDDLCRQV